ncbi:putative chitinase [Paraburkholderia sp. MM5496-R1]|uniref:glycoside hydrolase family 19 protein n=1 Tax=Paraburkholderia sp. MM5496-R1 TaxID=2991065 RepID=UPI003D232429
MTTQSNPEPPMISFSFPFRDAKGKEIVDEHVFYDWLASEGSGSFAITGSGMWHGGIHVSADGAGKQIDLRHGARCIAVGEVVAYRMNRIALASQIAAGNGKPAQTGHYSSAFTLVRHTLEYPANNRLTFFSLYMHLQSLADYQQNSMPAPAYWARSCEVTQYASDRPKTDPHLGPAPTGQVGLNIHAEAGSRTILGILPRGALVRIGERDRTGKWGRIEAIESGTPIPPRVASVVQPGADKGWLYLSKEHGHVLLAEVVSDAQCDQVVIPGKPIPVNAGDLIGHLGQYWLPDDPARDNRMVHIEVFCGDELSSFLSGSRKAAKKITDFDRLPLLRIGKGVKLFAGHSINEEGADAPETSVLQIYSQAALDALPAESKGPKDDAYGDGEPWWKVTSADSRHADISGWVRNRQMPPNGGVTRESPHGWKDFETVTGSDAGNPTMFSTVDAWLDHMLREDKPATGDASRLKPVASSVYRELSPMRNEQQAADELRAHKDDKWLRFRASRLIPKHRSEWASQSEYETFFDKVLKRVAKEPYHDAEIERVKKLVWWDDVKNAVKGPFPSSSDVYHIHPISLVGNFLSGACSCGKAITMEQLRAILPSDVLQHGLFYKANFAGIRNYSIENFLSLLNENIQKHGIVNCIHKVHFLAQFSHECDQLRTNEEYRNGDGSTPAGWSNYRGGSNFHGRGLIQLTHDDNYTKYGSAVGNSSIATDPDIVSQQVAHTVESACWYWRKGSAWGDINPMAERSDFLNVTIAVNGGYRHVFERNSLLLKLAPLLKLDECCNAVNVKLKHFVFAESAVGTSNWYNNHISKATEVEGALAGL